MPLPAHPDAHVICGFCGEDTPVGDGLSCDDCGAPLQVLEPLVVTCGWCRTPNERHLQAVCRSCGGHLPALPTGNPGRRPPAVPRELPKGYRRRVLLWWNVLSTIGAAFVVIFFWSVIFPIIGAPMWYFGHRKGKRWLHALQHGRATRGVLTRIARDRSQKRNGVSPWRIEYRYDLHDGTSKEGFVEAWDPTHGQRSEGDGVWVVYGALDGAEVSAIWPPLY
jgi:hypothetical protein